MCVFCAAIPAAASLGVVAASKQRAAEEAAQQHGEAKPGVRLPAGPISAVMVVLLLAGSVIYHTRFAA
jgi:hypothetical protein